MLALIFFQHTHARVFFLFFLWLFVAARSAAYLRFAIETLNNIKARKKPMDNLFDFRGRGCLLIQNFYRVVVVVVVARARTNFADTRTRAHLFVLLLFVAQINPRRKDFFYSSLSLVVVRSRTRERIIITDTYVVDITKER